LGGEVEVRRSLQIENLCKVMLIAGLETGSLGFWWASSTPVDSGEE